MVPPLLKLRSTVPVGSGRQENELMRALTKAMARGAGAAVVALTLVAPAEGAAILIDNANPQNIPGLSSFITDGSMMTGMSVSVFMSGVLYETAYWGTTGLTSGGVT